MKEESGKSEIDFSNPFTEGCSHPKAQQAPHLPQDRFNRLRRILQAKILPWGISRYYGYFRFECVPRLLSHISIGAGGGVRPVFDIYDHREGVVGVSGPFGCILTPSRSYMSLEGLLAG